MNNFNIFRMHVERDDTSSAVQLLQTKKAHISLLCLTVTLETLVVPVEPGGTSGTSLDTIGTVSTLAQTTSLASSASKTSTFSVFVHRVHNPVNTRIVTDLRVRRIYKNNFVIFHGSILVYPV
jgi:hypothetical protein